MLDSRRGPSTNLIAADRASERPVVRSVVDEAEDYCNSVAGIQIDAVRSGRGVASTEVLTAVDDRFTFTAGKVGFPMISRATVPDDMILVAYVRSATPGCRWCEIDLVPGAVLAYAPAAEHTARNFAGLDFMFGITGSEQLEEHADQLGIDIEMPGRGEVHLLTSTATTELVGPVFARFANHTASGQYPSSAITDDVLRSMALALSDEDRQRRIGRLNRIDSRHVVHLCIDYANRIKRIPSVSELCLVAHVSERRLRKAFTDEFNLPPSRYFRAWALDEAHRRLVRLDGTVTEVATGLGFDHLGRFAGHYKDIYGEPPSTTLHYHRR
jgi:AraC-like DNA-binding protein